MTEPARVLCVALVCVLSIGCLTIEEKDPEKRREAMQDSRTRKTVERTQVVGTAPEETKGSAVVFGRLYFYLDGYGGKKGDLRDDIKVRVTEYWPEGKQRHHWVTTDPSGYYQLTGVSAQNGYNVTEAVFPGSQEHVEVTMGPRMRADHRVLSLGEVICIVRSDGQFQNEWKDWQTYDVAHPLVRRALERNQGTKWEKLIRERHAISLKSPGF